MKKLLTTVALASIASGVFAQGQVSFGNLVGNITTNSSASSFADPGFVANSGSNGKIAAGGNGFYFTLLYTTGTTPANNNPLTAGWTQATYSDGVASLKPVVGTNYIIAGDMIGPKGTGTMLVDNWGAGVSGNYIIVGWSANLGTSWSQVSALLAADWAGLNAANNYYFGVTPIGTGTPTSNPSPAFNLWSGTAGTSLGLFQVGGAPVVTPEPATMVLAGLGGLSLLAFRRKK
jgi:hypothetical protein